MSIKVIIANNNDTLYNCLSNLKSQNELNIEIIKITNDKLPSFLCQIKPKEHLLILDCATSVTFCCNIVKNLMYRNKANIIILVIDSKIAIDIINTTKPSLFSKKMPPSNFSLFNAIDIVTNSIQDSLNIEKTLDTIFWKLGFTSYFKGTIYLRDAILLAYYDTNLLNDMNELVVKVSEKNKINNSKVVRSNMDKSLNSMLNYTSIDTIYDVFSNFYDGRKISVKYFIDLCTHYLENKDSVI